MIAKSVNRILDWHRDGILTDAMKAVELLRAEFAQLQSAASRHEFFEVIGAALLSEPLLPIDERRQEQVHLILIYVWGADGPVRKLISTVFELFTPGKEQQWAHTVCPSFMFMLYQHPLRFNEVALSDLREYCSNYTNSALADTRKAIAELVKATKSVEYQQYSRKLLGRKVASVAVPSLLDLQGRDTMLKDLQQYLDEGMACSVIYIDLDGFKQVNDGIGHAAGDTCLEETTLRTGRVILGKGTLYRPGGDEFVVVLPNFDIDEATATAERIKTNVYHVYEPGGLVVSASLGVASSVQHGSNAQELINAADSALRSSKSSGKNRVTAFGT